MRFAVTLALLLWGQAGWAEALLGLQNVSAPPGALAEVPLTVSAEARGFISGWVDVNAGAPDPTSSPPLPPIRSAVMGPLLPGSQILVNPLYQGSCRIAFASEQPGNGPGRLLSLLVQVPADAPVGTSYPLRIRGARLETTDTPGLEVALADAVLQVASPVPEDALLSVSDASAKPGSTVEVTVSANALLPPIQSADLTLEFHQVTLAGSPPLILPESQVKAGPLLPSAQLAARVASPGVLRAALASSASGGGPGVLLSFRVQVPESARPGTVYAFTLRGTVGLSNREWRVNTHGGLLTVTDTGEKPGWVLHLLPEPALLSETPGTGARAVPVTKNRWTLRLRGPLAGTPLDYQFYLRGPTAKGAEAKARLLWEPVGAAPVELGSWAISDIPAGPDPSVLPPVRGSQAVLGLLSARAGDTLALELTAPGALGAPTVQLLAGGPVGKAGDSWIRLGVGDPVSLEVHPAEAKVAAGDSQSLQAVVRVDGVSVPDAEVQWALLKPTTAAMVSDLGIFESKTPGEYQVGAYYQGMIAVSRLSVAALGPQPEPPDLPALGDANGDGQVNIGDVILALRFSVKLSVPTPEQEAGADVNQDGMLSIVDVIRILRIAVGLDKQPVSGA